jgi:F-type H+-transporting ATPase subunit b
MGLITPDYGLAIWMLISFGIVLYILKRFAWKPILLGLKNREETIAKSLRQAEEAREEIKKIQANNELLAEKARIEREQAFAEARRIRDQIVEDAKQQAQMEAQKIIDKSREIIRQEKEAARKELAQIAASLALELTERVLRKQFTEKEKHAHYINELIQEISNN